MTNQLLQTCSFKLYTFTLILFRIGRKKEKKFTIKVVVNNNNNNNNNNSSNVVILQVSRSEIL